MAVEDAEVFRKCISDHTLWGRYLRARAMGRSGGLGREHHGIRPDLEARGRYAHWARKNLHRASLRELSRCRHAALDRILLIPTETYVGDPEQCSRMDDSPDDPGISNAWDSSDARGASGGGPSRGA